MKDDMQEPQFKTPQSTRDAILDAAEHVFARKGYFGATIQEIFELAEANRGLLTYYFSTKEGLFAATLERRQLLFHEAFAQSISDMMARTGGRYTLYDLCYMYIHFLVELSYNKGKGWNNYITLLAAAISAYDNPDVSYPLAKFSDIQEKMIGLLAQAFPNAEELKLRRSMFYLESSIATALVSDRLIAFRIGVGDNVSWNEVVEDMAVFFSRAMATHCA